MSVDLSSVRGGAVGELTVILTVAVVGKMVGTCVASRLCHLPVRASATLAMLMNTRGRTELTVLAVGRQAGLLDADLYSPLVVMALATTTLTGSVLDVMGPVELDVAVRVR